MTDLRQEFLDAYEASNTKRTILLFLRAICVLVNVTADSRDSGTNT